jgi:hypothetical protein
MFWAAHQQVMASVDSIFGVAAQGGATALDSGLEGEPAGDEAAPADYPPGGTVAVGPAAQEQQMRELMRQMEDDARADAEEAAADAARNADPGADPYDPGQ